LAGPDREAAAAFPPRVRASFRPSPTRAAGSGAIRRASSSCRLQDCAGVTVGAAIASGLTVLGENRSRRPRPGSLLPGATWHLIGPLQSNKAAGQSSCSTSSNRSTRRPGAQARSTCRRASPGALQVYLQVTWTGTRQRPAFCPKLSRRSWRAARTAEPAPAGPDERGAAGGLGEEARPTFGRLRELSELLRGSAPGLGAGLSMGMRTIIRWPWRKRDPYPRRSGPLWGAAVGREGLRERLSGGIFGPSDGDFSDRDHNRPVMESDFRFTDRMRRSEVRFAYASRPAAGPIASMRGRRGHAAGQGFGAARGRAANAAMIRLLADELNVARSAVRLVAGATVGTSWSSSRESRPRK